LRKEPVMKKMLFQQFGGDLIRFACVLSVFGAALLTATQTDGDYIMEWGTIDGGG